MLTVYFQERLVGHIEESGPGLAFSYATEWIDASDAFAISLTMPLRRETYPAPVATPWFANLLPEDRMLEQIVRVLGRSPGDVYGLLEQIGRETAGALSVGEPEPIDANEYRALTEEELVQTIERLPARPLLAGEPEVTMSLAGAQLKLAVAMFDGRILLPLRGAASTHILKPESGRLYRTVENELLCMTLASRVGLPIAPAAMRMANGRRYLLIERYDRRIQAKRQVHRTHQEDFCQALGLYPTQKYEARQGPSFRDLFRVVDQYSRRRARDRLTLLDMAIFACCVGDTDRHGKNYSLILTDGGPRLSPGYDFLSSLVYENITRNLAMRISGKNRAEHLERRHWERFAQAVGLSPAATVRRVEFLAKAIGARVDPVIAELQLAFPIDSDAIRVFADRIRQQSMQVEANSQRGPAARTLARQEKTGGVG